MKPSIYRAAATSKPWVRYLVTGAVVLVAWLMISSPWIIVTWLLM